MPRGDAELEIRAFLDSLARQPWMDASRSYWPRFVFHITNVFHAANILASGQLLCRDEVLKRGLMVSDNASPAVIDQTDSEVHRLVRFYFRPRTPTFYNNEGIRPSGEHVRDSHCGVPIAFLFDAPKILSLPNSEISDGSRANRAEFRATVGHGIDFLRAMPFEQIYHDSWMPADRKEELIFRRHAEIGVPHAVDLAHLKYIVARSPAELTTLKSLLAEGDPGALAAHEPRMRSSTRASLFFKRWTFIEVVSAIESEIVIAFNTSTLSPGPFRCRLELEVVKNPGTVVGATVEALLATDVLRIDWPTSPPVSEGRLRVELDGHLAFLGPVKRSSSELLESRVRP